MTMPQNLSSRQTISDEHAALDGVLEHFRQTLVARQASALEVSALVHALARGILLHFRHEEARGLFTAATDAAPWLCERANQLLREHQEMATQLLLLQEHVAEGAEDEGWWQGLDELFQQFMTVFSMHEAAENALVRAVYCDDVGTGD